MNKQVILIRQRDSYEEFVTCILSLSEEDYNYNHNGEKWDAGQQLDHINRAVNKLAKGSVLPKFLIKWKFGKANRPSRSFEDLVAKYQKGIANGFKATGPFLPEPIPFSKRNIHIDKLMNNIRKIEKNIGTYAERELDEIIIRHPAMGLLTMRELLYFNTHHVEDHLRQLKRNLSWK